MWDLPTRARSSAEPRSAGSPDPSTPDYAAAIAALIASYDAIGRDGTVRLAKRTSNLFRTRRKISSPGLDVSGLGGVLSIDVDGLTADVGGMCTYEDLVAATLPLGLAPLVVPQLKTITVGGAATGGGIESSSFRSGLVFDDIVEMDVFTGAGRGRHRNAGRRTRRPVLRFSELVRDPGVRHPTAGQTGTRQAFRRAAASAVQPAR